MSPADRCIRAVFTPAAPVGVNFVAASTEDGDGTNPMAGATSPQYILAPRKGLRHGRPQGAFWTGGAGNQGR